MRSLLFLILIFLTVPTLVAAATIHGTIYDLTLDPVDKAKVKISTIPEQVFVTSSGTYSFDVPQGNYSLTAHHGSMNDYVAQENITVVTDGVYVIDLILYPVFSDEQQMISDLQEIDIESDIGSSIIIDTMPRTLNFILLVIFLLFLGIFWYFFRKKKRTKKRIISDDTKFDISSLPDKAITLMKAHGGRMTQKELRRELPYSEAKISLVVAELESKGLVRKIKKGRGNILILR